ncbi:hypothetical protein L1987_48517 [Smallanthus sonchifolius]|uniref:Uncharacterized protein n=1 Tax=Smallanthus sonchifolius TaxID=185202 RepID=A0ACB9FS77_9ASTR|nr:hypothetical protein L1987_48517 [Smallanthus sonchifolius]
MLVAVSVVVGNFAGQEVVMAVGNFESQQMLVAVGNFESQQVPVAVGNFEHQQVQSSVFASEFEHDQCSCYVKAGAVERRIDSDGGQNDCAVAFSQWHSVNGHQTRKKRSGRATGITSKETTGVDRGGKKGKSVLVVGREMRVA